MANLTALAIRLRGNKVDVGEYLYLYDDIICGNITEDGMFHDAQGNVLFPLGNRELQKQMEAKSSFFQDHHVLWNAQLEVYAEVVVYDEIITEEILSDYKKTHENHAYYVSVRDGEIAFLLRVDQSMLPQIKAKDSTT